MTYKVDQFAAIHPRVEGEIYVDWDKVRTLALKGEIGTSQHDVLTGQLAQALLEKGRRIEDLEGALRNLIEHTLNCEFEIDVQMGLGNDAGAGMSDVLCKARAALKGNKDVHNGSN